VGSALNGKKAGEKVEVTAPHGTITLEIKEVSRR
jgi:transcription elongation GreA/GreB family factor